ncbi:YcnI family protein [uncultured Jatrophihabitans sp.]|uniref:YcnI family protein n=1 Tax=uncultured Jatrophihabitans sp. TaxID=1610747 RepID=UPI0035C9D86A
MHRIRTVALLLLAAAVAALAFAASADAHVTVTAPGAQRGGSDQEITFRVPVEKQADTTALTVVLPTSTPIASVLVEPLPGWTHVQRTSRLAQPIKTDDGDITSAVTQITWTAQPGHALRPGEFGAFTVIAGQLPDASSITFRALQTYSDGSVVRWIETPAPGSSAEPENPAPVLTLAAGDGPRVTAAKPQAAASDTGPVVLSIVALVLAAAALGLAVLTSRRRRGAAS